MSGLRYAVGAKSRHSVRSDGLSWLTAYPASRLCPYQLRDTVLPDLVADTFPTRQSAREWMMRADEAWTAFEHLEVCEFDMTTQIRAHAAELRRRADVIEADLTTP